MQRERIDPSAPGSASQTSGWAVIVGWGTLLGLLLVGFLVAPFNEDVRSQFAAARQADYHGAFPGNIVEAWDIKPFGNRMVIYTIYRAAAAAVSFQDKRVFEPMVHGMCLGAILACLALFRRSGRAGSGSDLRRSGPSAGLGLVSILAVSYYVILQPEWFASLLLLAAIGLSCTDSRAATVVAGVLASFLLPLKGVTVLLVPIVPSAWGLAGLDWRKRSIPFVSGLTLGTALWGLFFYLYPQSWQDLLDATAYQNSIGGFAPMRRALNTIAIGFGGAMSHAPMVYVGLVGTTLIGIAGIARRAYRDPLLLAAAWGCAILVVMIQGKWFPYHFAVAVVPAWLAVVTWCSDRYAAWNESLTSVGRWRAVAIASVANLVLAAIVWRYAPEQRGTIPLAVASCTLVAVVLVHGPRYLGGRGAMPAIVAVLSVIGWGAVAAPWTPDARSAAAAGAEQQAWFSELDARHRLSEEPSLLFLEGGAASYFVSPRSTLRWIYPLPLQRLHSCPELAKSKVHATALGQSIAYEGRFIILDSAWMHTDQRLIPSLSTKLEQEYEVVDSTDLLHDHRGRNRYLLLRRR